MHDRLGRVDQARAVAGGLDADHLLCLSDGVHSYLHPNPVFLLTGFKSVGPSAVLVGRNDGLTLLVAPTWDEGRARATVGSLGDAMGCEDVGIAAAGILSGASGRTAVAGIDAVPERTRGAIEAVTDVVQADAELFAAAGAKTPGELELARRATAIAEEAFEQILGDLRHGMTEYELVARLDAEMARRGADDNFLLMSSGLVGEPVRAPEGRRLVPGDTVLLEFSPSCEGQFTQLCRSVVLGKPTPRQRADYELLQGALSEAVAAARPGATVDAVVAAMDRPLEEAGLARYCRPPYMRVRGHGQGLASVSPGDIARGNETELVEGMVFVLHPNQFFPESGYLLCGDPVVVTATGCERLTRREPELESV